MQTGFDGGDDAWATEFFALCRDNQRDPVRNGIDTALFAKLVNDQSDLGIYCKDDAGREIVLFWGT